jgi:hypothetical protein
MTYKLYYLNNSLLNNKLINLLFECAEHQEEVPQRNIKRELELHLTLHQTEVSQNYLIITIFKRVQRNKKRR